MLVTLGAEGMYLWSSDDAKTKCIYLSATAQEVFDVSGAGDTVAAIATLSLAAMRVLPTRLDWLTSRAVIVVTKWGTHPVEQQKLIDALATTKKSSHQLCKASDKISELAALKDLLGPPASRHRKVVFTNGCFDLMHAGHATYLEKARELGDCLVVAVNSDHSVARLKGAARPIISQAERALLIASLACVDHVLVFEEDTPLAVIENLLPDILVKGPIMIAAP